MGVIGWSSTSMATRYQHVTDPIIKPKDVAKRVRGPAWQPPERPDGTDDQGDEGTAGVPVAA
jgi:integrase